MTLTKKHGVYRVAIQTPRGTKHISTGATTKADANRVVKESGVKELELAGKSGRLTSQAIGQITTGRKLTMAKAAQAFLEWLESVGRSAKTIHNYANVLTVWLREAGIENAPPSSIDENHINKWINSAKSEDTASTRTAALATVRSFFDFASAKGWTVGNPSKLVRINMRTLSHAQKEPKVITPFNKMETNRLLKHTEDHGLTFWHNAILISRESGLRLGDVARLEWDCFGKAGHIIVWTNKRIKRVALPISEQLQEAITTIPAAHPKYIFPEQREIAIDPKRSSGLSVQFMRLCERCEITGKSFHSLRHAFITELSRQGKTLEDIGVLVGHSDTKTTQRYVHLMVPVDED